MSLDYPLTIRAAADRNFIEYATACLDRHIDECTPNSFDPERRKWWRYGADPILDAKKQELIGRFGLPDWVPEPEFGDFIGSISQGGSVHPHRDGAPADMMHVRINLLVRKAESGCIPLIENQPLDIGLGDAWVCIASQCRHATTPVVGKTARSIVSYGMLVDRVAGLPLYAKYFGWMSAISRATERAGGAATDQ